MTDALVLADDRTGALEVAGLAAQKGLGSLAVWVGPPGDDATGIVVVDLGSRHLSPSEAADRIGIVAERRWAIHKIDSTLRGNWATEVVVRHSRRGGRVLVAAGFPQLGRRCRAGVVTVNEIPVDETVRDARSTVRSPRPADHLMAAGSAEAELVAGASDLDRWHGAEVPIGICDVIEAGDLTTIGRWWAGRDDVMLVGTAATAAAALVALVPAGPVPAPPQIRSPVLIVCGSLHPMARAQVADLGSPGSLQPRPGRAVGVVATAEVDRSVTAAEAAATAATTARDAYRAAATMGARTIVVLGGDTAAAVLGDRRFVVHGTVDDGTPWGTLDDGTMVITRSGGFGDPSSLRRLVSGSMAS